VVESVAASPSKGEAATEADHYYRVMTDTHGARTEGTGATEDVQRLQARIRELEQQLATRDAAARNVTTGSGGNRGLKFVAAALAAVSVVMALPAFLTIRRWIDWWR
jgi:hypothetical protein